MYSYCEICYLMLFIYTAIINIKGKGMYLNLITEGIDSLVGFVFAQLFKKSFANLNTNITKKHATPFNRMFLIFMQNPVGIEMHRVEGRFNVKSSFFMHTYNVYEESRF